jgi:hypothetical protein
MLKIKYHKRARQKVRHSVFPPVAGFPPVRQFQRWFFQSTQQPFIVFFFILLLYLIYFEIGIAD